MIDSIYKKRDSRIRRESSYDITGGNRDNIVLEPGASHTVAISGSGIIKHMWFTYGHNAKSNTKDYRHQRIRISFDDAQQPNVDMSVADFFGFGHGCLCDIDNEFFQVVRTENHPVYAINLPPHRGGLNCYLPMPFRRNAEIVLTNLDGGPMVIYYHIDWEECEIPDDALYFHALFNEMSFEPCNSEPTPNDSVNMELVNLTDAANYQFLDIKGCEGHFAGMALSVKANRSAPGRWWEGDEMFVIDGEPWPPRIHGTGTEDYFGLAYGVRRVVHRPQFGVILVDKTTDDLFSQVAGAFSLYRYHCDAPISFLRSLRASIECGHANESGAYYRSTAYWYGRRLAQNI